MWQAASSAIAYMRGSAPTLLDVAELLARVDVTSPHADAQISGTQTERPAPASLTPRPPRDVQRQDQKRGHRSPADTTRHDTTLPTTTTGATTTAMRQFEEGVLGRTAPEEAGSEAVVTEEWVVTRQRSAACWAGVQCRLRLYALAYRIVAHRSDLADVLGPSWLAALVGRLGALDPEERHWAARLGRALAATPLRWPLWRLVRLELMALACETRAHHGPAELLALLRWCSWPSPSASAASASPTAPAHDLRETLALALLPLHALPLYKCCAGALAKCVCECLARDPALAPAVLRGLCRAWPAADSAREAMLVAEAADVLQLAPPGAPGALPLVARLAGAVRGGHYIVASRAMLLFESPGVREALAPIAPDALALVVPAVLACAELRWSPEMRKIALNCLKTLRLMDEAAYAKALLLAAPPAGAGAVEP
eukprot:m51a1_g9845 hypothetical protein (429) ;mRNA; r:1959831-1961250